MSSDEPAAAPESDPAMSPEEGKRSDYMAEILSGRAPLIEKDWQISVPGSLAGKGLDFLSRITGVYSPYSWIPGDYFAVDGKKSFINQTINFVGSLLGRPQLLPTTKNGSDIFLANTGQGSVSALFSALEYKIAVTGGT